MFTITEGPGDKVFEAAQAMLKDLTEGREEKINDLTTFLRLYIKIFGNPKPNGAGQLIKLPTVENQTESLKPSSKVIKDWMIEQIQVNGSLGTEQVKQQFPMLTNQSISMIFSFNKRIFRKSGKHKWTLVSSLLQNKTAQTLMLDGVN